MPSAAAFDCGGVFAPRRAARRPRRRRRRGPSLRGGRRADDRQRGCWVALVGRYRPNKTRALSSPMSNQCLERERDSSVLLCSSRGCGDGTGCRVQWPRRRRRSVCGMWEGGGINRFAPDFFTIMIGRRSEGSRQVQGRKLLSFLLTAAMTEEKVEFRLYK